MQNLQTVQDQKMQAEYQKEMQEEEKQALLAQFLNPQAKERLMKVKIVRPDNAMAIQNEIIKGYQSGTFKKRLTQNQLVGMLERNSEARASAKIIFKRHQLDEEW